MPSWECFSDNELRCKCGCNRNDIDPGFMDKLVVIRKAVGFPMILSSAYRCPEYNRKVSSTGPDGPHTKGAVDVLVFGSKAYAVMAAAFRHGMTGIGVSQKGTHAKRFIHLDDLTTPPRPWPWSY